MIVPILVTLLPVLFLTVLFSGGALLRHRNIDVDGDPPINRTAFYTSKYSILLLWAAMVLQIWGVNLAFIDVGRWLRWLALALWAFGFTVMLIGRLGLGDSFRIGSARESTKLKVGGLFRLSRNPMYVGVFSTLLASVIYTANPVVLLLAVFAIAVHHRIVRAEEQHLSAVFGQEYAAYCTRVRRYL